MRATRAEVDLSAIQYNVKQIARKVGNARILGVMKANAYGHGIVQASKAVLEAGASYVGVALPEEGIELRKHTDAPILVFSPPFEADDLNQPLESYIRYDLEPTITSMEIAHALNSVAKAGGKKARVQIKIDTGMGRIGFFPEFAMEAIGAIAKLESLSIVGIYSHFATSDESNKEFARRQLLAFRNIVSAVKDLGLECIFHIANSGAVLDMPDSYFDMVRPGITTYGYYPSLETTESVDIRPALVLKSNVVQVRDFKTGMSVSYGRRYFTKGPARIAVIPIGYGDGFTRLLTGKASVLIREKEYPVAGTITMDHLMVDVGNDPDIQPGDEVTLIGRSGDREITAWDIAAQLGTIPYEVLCMISSRVPRLYKNNSLGD